MKHLSLWVLIAALIGARATAASAAPALLADTGINFHLTAAQIGAACDAAIAQTKTKIAGIEAVPLTNQTWATGLAAVETAEAIMADALIAPAVLYELSPDKKVRDASAACSQKVDNYNVQLAADPQIYFTAKRAYDAGLAQSVIDRKLAQVYVENGRRSGASLTPSQRAVTTKLFQRLNDLERDFGIALTEESVTIKITKGDAVGLSRAQVSAFKTIAGGYLVPVNESTVSEFMNNERNPDARKRYLVAYNRRGGAKNVRRLEQAIALRDKLAHIFGFPNWAAYQLNAKMAKKPKRVIAFLTQIDRELLPKAQSEIARLATLKRVSGDRTPFQRWDYRYYETQLEKTKYTVDDRRVRKYFPVDHVIAAVMRIYETLLGVKFAEIEPADAWAPGVREFSIADAATGKPIGWLFFDLFPRPGKFEHFASFPLRAGRRLPDGSFQKPVDAIVGNWPQPEPGKPALLSHDDVITFFHEFGHAMHGTLSTAPYESLYGTAVRGDFVEAPSQMLENWMWQPSILKMVSSNVETGKPLPDGLIKRMIALKHIADGIDYTTNAFYGEYDMTIHTSGPKVDATSVWFRLLPRMTPWHAIPGTFPEAGFGHIMGGYDAGYYGYLWSLVYAQDMFTRFERGGLLSPSVGMAYRKDILEPGATIEPDQLMRDFLGRLVRYDAFYRQLGITNKM